MSGITTHVLDTAAGKPAEGVAVRLERQTRDGWEMVGIAATDAEGRVRTIVPADSPIAEGVYRLTFDTQSYYDRAGASTFYPSVVVMFRVTDAADHYHVPLLVSPWGYSTYRGT